MTVQKNMGIIDRSLRAFASIILFYLGLFNDTLVTSETIRYILTGMGVINITTSVFGFCPLYTAARISTIARTAE